MSTVKWLESKIISETQRAEYAEGRVRALLLELDKKDAALRRAKVEVWREAAQDLIERAENCNRILTDGRRLYALDERMWVAKRELLQALVLEYSARAAQIEEGE